MKTHLFVLFLISFIVYSINFRAIPTGDSASTFLSLIVLLTQGNICFDQFGCYVDEQNIEPL